MNGGNTNQELPVNPETEVTAETPLASAPKKSSKKVIIISAVVIIMVILLIIIVAIVMNINHGNPEVQEETNSETVDLDEDEPIASDDNEENARLIVNAEIVDEIRSEVYYLNLDDAIDYIDSRLEEYTDADTRLAIELFKIRIYVGEEQPVVAEELFDELDTGEFSDYDYLDYYYTGWVVASSLEDETKAREYAEQYNEYYTKIYGGEDSEDRIDADK